MAEEVTDQDEKITDQNNVKTIYMHIGHGKTGSSFLQSIFSTNREYLQKNNIFYPIEKTDKSHLGHISSGNGIILTRHLREEGSLGKFLENIQEDNVFFSSEFFHHETNWINHNEMLDGSNFKKAKILLFIRNPANLISSMYQQTIKRGGYHGSIDGYTAGYSFYRKLYNTIKILLDNDFYDLSIYNYSNHKKTLNDLTAKWLGFDSFPKIPFKKVNRSLTYSELFFQQEINRYFGKSGNLISDPLCTKLPDLNAAIIMPSKEGLMEFLDREGNYIEKINAFIPSSEHLVVDLDNVPMPEKDIELSAEQIRIICGSLGRNLVRKKPD